MAKHKQKKKAVVKPNDFHHDPYWSGTTAIMNKVQKSSISASELRLPHLEKDIVTETMSDDKMRQKCLMS